MTQEGSADKAERKRVNTPDGMFIRDMPEGTKLELKNGDLVEITLNARDGGWLMARCVESENDPDRIGTEDWIFFAEVAAELEA